MGNMGMIENDILIGSSATEPPIITTILSAGFTVDSLQNGGSESQNSPKRQQGQVCLEVYREYEQFFKHKNGSQITSKKQTGTESSPMRSDNHSISIIS